MPVQSRRWVFSGDADEIGVAACVVGATGAVGLGMGAMDGFEVIPPKMLFTSYPRSVRMRLAK